MIANRLLLVLLSLCCIGSNTLAFDGEQARHIVSSLSGDDFEGRRSGHRGGTKAEEYVAQLFRDWGVRTGGSDGYFQTVPMLVTDQIEADLTLMNHELGRIPFLLGSDFQLVTHSGSGTIIAPVVVAGYGYVRPDKGRNDYETLNVSGKIVLLFRGDVESPWDFGEDFPRKHSLNWAKERGARAILWYPGEGLPAGAAIPEEVYDPDLPLLYVGQRVASLLLDGTGYSLKTYTEKIKTATLPLETGKEMYVNTRVQRRSKAIARNVLGMVYGTDPVLKNEVVVVGGHLDHIGMNANDIIYNGADDNASGSGVVCELARTIAASPLKRSVMFMLFMGEEDGLLGSDYFVKNPTIPLGNIACMLNFDMEGQGDGRVHASGGELIGSRWKEFRPTPDSTAEESLSFSRSYGGGSSDHASFIHGGVPAIAFWSRGDHPFYHQYTDDSNWIKTDVLQSVGDRAEQILRHIGNAQGVLAAGADSLTLMARMSTTMDLRGFSVGKDALLPAVNGIQMAWLPDDASTPSTELVRRISELRWKGETQQLVVDGLKQAQSAINEQSNAVVIGVSEAAISKRTPQDVAMLVCQGLDVVKLSPTPKSAAAGASDGPEKARELGVVAVMPLDFGTPGRVEEWKRNSIVTATPAEILALPDDARNGLLNSDAFLFLDATSEPSMAELDAIRPYAARWVHLHRSHTARAHIESLFSAGFDRRDILRLTGGNLRRYLNSRSGGSGHADD